MVNYSLNQLINIIEAISAAHLQLKSFKFSEEMDISASQEIYPLLWANILPADIAEKTLSVNIDFMVLDKVQDDNRNERDTLSDCLQIVGDLLATFKNPDYQDYFQVDGATSPEPVRHTTPDVVNGWRFTVRFELAFESNRCQVPAI